MADYRKLEVGLAAKRLAVTIYRLTESLPEQERYNLTIQIQKCAVSVVANIAEGAGRGTDLDFARFIRIALGSLSELSALLDLVVDLGMLDSIPENDIRDLYVRLLNLQRRLERDGGRVVRDQAVEYLTQEEQL